MTRIEPNYIQLQHELKGFTTRKGAVEFLHTNFPHKSKAWLNRHLPKIYELSPDMFIRVFMHADTTGEHAVNLVNEQRHKTIAPSVNHHEVTVRQALVKQYGCQLEGEIVSCVCGWERRWGTRNGYATIEGRLHEMEMAR